MIGLFKKRQCSLRNCNKPAKWLVVTNDNEEWLYCDDHFKKSKIIFDNKKQEFTDTTDNISYIVNLDSKMSVLATFNRYVLLEVLKQATDSTVYNIARNLLELLMNYLSNSED